MPHWCLQGSRPLTVELDRSYVTYNSEQKKESSIFWTEKTAGVISKVMDMEYNVLEKDKGDS